MRAERSLGVAFQINPKAVFNLIFFASLLFVSYIAKKAEGKKQEAEGKKQEAEGRRQKAANGESAAFCFLPSAFYVLIGFIVGSLLLLGHVAATKSLTAYWLYVWDWGARYAGYYSASKLILSALLQTAGYFALNPVLLIALVYLVASIVRRVRAGKGRSDIVFNSDVTLLLWLAASYAGLAVGGRFFGHYFLQIIPALCLVGARGVIGIIRDREAVSGHGGRLLIAALIIGFAFTLARFHGRTALLAMDWLWGSKSAATADWFHERLNREENMAAAAVRELPADAEAVENLDFDAMRKDSPRARAPRGPQDYLFVWGYRPEIYYWSGLLPASRYLSTQPLTGVPADVHYFGQEHSYLLDEVTTAGARLELLRELEQVQPKYIVDELGYFNSGLGIQKYPELEEFMRGYKFVKAAGRFLIYQKRNPHKKDRLRKRARKQMLNKRDK